MPSRALYTGVAYLLGMAFPVLSFLFASSSLVALPVSMVLAGLSLTLVGSAIALLSGISIWRKIVEMVLSGLIAAGLSYGFGVLMRSLFGIGVAG